MIFFVLIHNFVSNKKINNNKKKLVKYAILLSTFCHLSVIAWSPRPSVQELEWSLNGRLPPITAYYITQEQEQQQEKEQEQELEKSTNGKLPHLVPSPLPRCRKRFKPDGSNTLGKNKANFESRWLSYISKLTTKLQTKVIAVKKKTNPTHLTIKYWVFKLFNKTNLTVSNYFNIVYCIGYFPIWFNKGYGES